MNVVCDLVLLSWNHLDATRPCLESLFRTTGVPVRLFIVDNGSEPDVRSFLQGVKPQGAVKEVVLLQNETNEGFPRGMNRGLQASTAPFVCLLNNDLRFTSGWLEEMLAIARSRPSIGIINPVNDNTRIRSVTTASLEAYAETLRPQRGQFTEAGMCIGFCFLIKREVLDRIGGLTEEVERIFFEDEDFSMRAQQAGFQCVVASGAYVFHAEHQSVKDIPDHEALFRRNQRWCHTRWGRWVRVAWPRFHPVVPGSDELRQWLERLLIWTRRRTYVHVYCPTQAGVTKEELFRSVGLAPHADIRWKAISPALARWTTTGLILKRQKKRFDIIVAPDARWGAGISRLQWLHRARVIPETDEETLQTSWETLRAQVT